MCTILPPRGFEGLMREKKKLWGENRQKNDRKYKKFSIDGTD